MLTPIYRKCCVKCITLHHNKIFMLSSPKWYRTNLATIREGDLDRKVTLIVRFDNLEVLTRNGLAPFSHNGMTDRQQWGQVTNVFGKADHNIYDADYRIGDFVMITNVAAGDERYKVSPEPTDLHYSYTCNYVIAKRRGNECVMMNGNLLALPAYLNEMPDNCNLVYVNGNPVYQTKGGIFLADARELYGVAKIVKSGPDLPLSSGLRVVVKQDYPVTKNDVANNDYKAGSEIDKQAILLKNYCYVQDTALCLEGATGSFDCYMIIPPTAVIGSYDDMDQVVPMDNYCMIRLDAREVSVHAKLVAPGSVTGIVSEFSERSDALANILHVPNTYQRANTIGTVVSTGQFCTDVSVGDRVIIALRNKYSHYLREYSKGKNEDYVIAREREYYANSDYTIIGVISDDN